MKKAFALAVIFLDFLLPFGVHADGDTAAPSIPTSMSATAVPPSQVNVSWGASSDNVGVTGYYVYRNGSFYAAVGGTSYTDVSLPPGVYSYTVAAYDAAGNFSAQSGAASAALISDKTPPSKPANVTAKAVSPNVTSQWTATSIKISWQASTDNTAVVGYYVYRDGTLLTTSTILSDTSWTDSVTPGTYAYTVVAYDRGQNASDASLPAAVTVSVDNTGPSAPANPVAVQGTAFPLSVDVSWKVSYDAVGVAGYRVYRGGTLAGDVGPTVLSYTDKNLSPVTYLYSVIAYDAAGNVSNASPQVAVLVQTDAVAPSVPQRLSAAPTSSGVMLSWGASTDNIFVSGYLVYRDTKEIANVSSTQYIDTDTSSNATGTYEYAVTAHDPTGNASGKASLAVTPIKLQPVSSNPITAQNPAPVSIPSPSANPPLFTIFLSYGSKHPQVKNLQLLFVKQAYLSADSATGFFGKLTEQAVKKFQCDKNIACSGNPASTGWGTVGAKTRAALNALSAGGVLGESTSAQADLVLQIQALQALLLQLQAQAHQ